MRMLGAVLLTGTTFLSACGGSSSAVTTAPGPTPTLTVSGIWAGSASDSTTAGVPGQMMGQSGMGTMTWQLTQTGNSVKGSMAFSGMPTLMPGSIVGTMDADDMTFTADMPMASMMSGRCAATAKGTVHVDRGTMTMTGTYSGSNSCSGAFADGHMDMARR